MIVKLLFTLFCCSPTNNVATDFVCYIANFSNYSTVEWSELREKYYRPNAADWGEEVEQRFHNEFPREIAAEWWHLLQNARTDFHQASLPYRATNPEEVISAIERTEALFDTVFVRCVEQEYYMRLFPEVYNEVMGPGVDSLIAEINKNK